MAGGMPVDSNSDTESDCAVVSFVVTNARRVSSKKKDLFALVDVEMRVGDVCFVLLGVQARSTPGGDGMSVYLPTYNDTDGSWCPAIRLPDEMNEPLGNAVLEFLMNEGLARRKFLADEVRGM
jgi:hypothetical protein